MCDYTEPALREAYLPAIAAEELWGIGRASASKLAAIGVTTVGQLRTLVPTRARQIITVVGERIIHELNGVFCLPLEAITPQRKDIAVTRSFSRPVVTLSEIGQAVAAYATRAGEKLRRHRVAAVQGFVFMHTHAHNSDPWCHVGKLVEFLEASDDTVELVAAAVRAAQRAWRPCFRWAKAGLVPVETVQRSFLTTLDRVRRAS